MCVKNNPQSVPQPVPQYVSQSVPQPVAINKLNNTKLNKEKSKKEKKSDFDFSLIPEEFIPIVKKWLKYKSEKGQTYKKTEFRTRQCNLDIELCSLISTFIEVTTLDGDTKTGSFKEM